VGLALFEGASVAFGAGDGFGSSASAAFAFGTRFVVAFFTAGFPFAALGPEVFLAFAFVVVAALAVVFFAMVSAPVQNSMVPPSPGRGCFPGQSHRASFWREHQA